MYKRQVELLSQNIGNRVVAIQKGELVDFEINEALAMHKTIDERLLNIGHAIVAQAVFDGWEKAVRDMKALMVQARLEALRGR